MAYKGKRSFLCGPWHYCNRCEFKWHISELNWQRGLLLCPWCFDYGNNGYPLIGQREAAINAMFEEPSQELMPDPKLIDSTEIQSSLDEDVLY